MTILKPAGAGFRDQVHHQARVSAANTLRKPSITAQAGLKQIRDSRGILHHRLSNVVFEVDKAAIRPVAFPGGSLKQMGKIHKEDDSQQMLLEITGEGPFYFSVPGRQIGPDSAGKAVAFIVPFDRLDANGVTKSLDVIM
jgi:hypothetical protein